MQSNCPAIRTFAKRCDMETRVIKEVQDLTYLKWSHIRSSSGTAGTFLKASSTLGGRKTYYKLSNFDPVQGVVGHECVNEIIVDRMLTLLGVGHLSYELIHADIEVENRIFRTWLCASEDFKKPGESKIAIDDYFRINAIPGESHYDFCLRMGFGEYIDQMLAVDYLILNRDRHGANIEVLRNARAHTIRIAPLFDHGLSLLYSSTTEEDADSFAIMEDRPCQNFIGTRSCLENLSLIRNRQEVFPGKLEEGDRAFILEDLSEAVPTAILERSFEMICRRYRYYEEL